MDISPPPSPTPTLEYDETVEQREEIEGLELKVSSLETKVSSLEAEVAMLKAENNLLKTEKPQHFIIHSDIINKLSAAEAQIVSLKQKNRDIYRKCDDRMTKLYYKKEAERIARMYFANDAHKEYQKWITSEIQCNSFETTSALWEKRAREVRKRARMLKTKYRLGTVCFK